MTEIRAWLGGACPILLSCLLLLTLAGCGRETYRDVVQDFADRPIGEITAGITIGQTFVPNHNYLNGVAVLMATYARGNTCNIVFHLRREGEQQDLFTQGLKCADIQDNQWLRFNFPPIKDSLQQKFFFLFESPDASRDNSVTIWMAGTPNIYSEGQMLVNGKPIPGALRFMTYHEG